MLRECCTQSFGSHRHIVVCRAYVRGTLFSYVM